MLYITSIIAILIPLSILILPGSIFFPYIFLAGGIVFAIHTISTEGILLEVTNNENRALYTGLSGAGNILPVVCDNKAKVSPSTAMLKCPLRKGGRGRVALFASYLVDEDWKIMIDYN